MKKKVSIVRALSGKARKTERVPRAVQSKYSTRDILLAGEESEEERWQRDMATLRRAAEDLAKRRSGQDTFAHSNGDQFDRIAGSLIECTDEQRPATIKHLYSLNPERAAAFLNTVLHACSREERQQIGRALELSGLVDEAIQNLTGRSHSNSYRAFSLLFLVAKAGAIGPVMCVIEDHPSIELRLALIRLLSSSGALDLPVQFQRLLTSNSMPSELSVAIKEALSQLGDNTLEVTPSAA